MKRQHNRITRRLFTILDATANDEDLLRQEIRALAFEEMEAFMFRVYSFCEAINSNYYGRTQKERLQAHWFNGPPVREKQPRFTTEQISSAFRITQSHAGVILKALFDMGLMGREATRDEDGREFEYWII